MGIVSQSNTIDDEKYMRRALQLARLGEGNVSPNPMVGAVIVSPEGRIIGEGYHRRWGGPHAEVNAIRSVSDADSRLLGDSTIYVTLEPCSHYGKTPPCSQLLIDKGLHRVVVGAGDPFKEVAGRGIAMLRAAGIEVTEGVLEEECCYINRRFMTAHTLGRPWIELKWAESADGYLARRNPETGKIEPVQLSDAVGQVYMHRERSLVDAILVGPNTARIDNPALTCRRWPGRAPRPILFRGYKIPTGSPLAEREPILIEPHTLLLPQMKQLYADHGITSLMVEGGAAILNSFIAEGLYDEIRRETSSLTLGTTHGFGRVIHFFNS